VPRAFAVEAPIEAKLIQESRRVRTSWTIALALALISAPVVATSAKAASKNASKPVAAPAFTLPGLKGDVSLESLRGKTVLVDFWASWCGPCRQSFPWMNELQRRYGAKGLAIVAVNLDKDREFANTFLAELPASFTVVFDPAGTTAEHYKVKVLPSTFLISPDGRLLATHTGFDAKKAPEFEARIVEALPR
jgi:thiol-disulfide isomerase/thioredoxin